METSQYIAVSISQVISCLFRSLTFKDSLEFFVPALVAFLFTLLLKKVACKNKALTITYWAILAVVPVYALVVTITELINFYLYSSDWLALERAKQGVFILVVYGGGVWAGRHINPRRIKHWILFVLAILLCYLAWGIKEGYPPFITDFGKIEDKPLVLSKQDSTENVDYALEVFFSDAWYNDARLALLKVRNDSVFSCHLRSNCGGISSSDYDSCQWVVLDRQALSNLDSLKASVENYKTEYIDYMIFDGGIVYVTLKDYRKGHKRKLELGNANRKSVPKAYSIVDRAEKFLPPYDTSGAHKDELKKCFEEANASALADETDSAETKNIVP